MQKLIGILPAAGMGKRLQPYNSPKELITIGYQTMHYNKESKLVPMVVSQYVINAMHKATVRNILFVLSPTKWEIAKFFMSGAHFDTCFGYVCQDKPLGMPQALDTAYSWVTDCTIFMGMPDTIIEPTDCFEQLFAFYREKKADVCLGIFPTHNPYAFAPVHIDAVSGQVIEIFDKPYQTTHFNTWGIAIWSPAFTELLHSYIQQNLSSSAHQELILSDVFTEAIAQNLRVYGKKFPQGKYYDIGTLEGLKMARMALERV